MENTLKNFIKLSLSMTLLTVISACSTVPYQTSSPQVEDRSTGTVTTPPSRAETTKTSPAPVESPAPIVVEQKQALPALKQSPAVIALLSNADKQQQQGDYRSAQNTLQRAQRIAPRDPQVYYALATTHLQLESYALAEQVALKGVSLVQGQPSQLKKFWNLIAEIRLQSGNVKGAEQAKKTADKY